MRLERVGVMPQRVRPAQLLVDEAMRRVPLADRRQPADRHAAHAQAVADQRARTHRRSASGVDHAEAQQRRRDRLEVARVAEEREDLARACRAGAARGAGCARWRSCGGYAAQTMEDLRSAPPPPLRDDDHVRGDPDASLDRLLRGLHVPALRARARAPDGRRRARRLPPHGAARQGRARAADRAAPPRPPRRRARSGRSPTRCTPTRDASTTRTCGSARARWASTSSASTPTAAARRRRARVQRDTRAALAAGATTTPMLFAAGIVHSGVPDGELPRRASATMTRFGYRRQARCRPADRRARPSKGKTSYEHCRDPCLRRDRWIRDLLRDRQDGQAGLRRSRRPPGRHRGSEHRDRGQPPRRRLPPADGGCRGAHVRRGQDPRLVLQARGPQRREGHAHRPHDRPPAAPAVPQGLAS